jgi:hypothetical protein
VITLVLVADLVGCITVPTEVKATREWTDKNGDNQAIFKTLTEEHNGRKSIYLEVAHDVMENGKPRLVRNVRDQELDCDGDLIDGFREQSIAVTDLDGNGYSELTFAYWVDGCMTDMSSATMKLILLENGHKWIVRAPTVWPEKKASPEARAEVKRQLAKWPAAFRAHAQKIWDANSRKK